MANPIDALKSMTPQQRRQRVAAAIELRQWPTVMADIELRRQEYPELLTNPPPCYRCDGSGVVYGAAEHAEPCPVCNQ